MSLARARFGLIANVTAIPPQKGSTSLFAEAAAHSFLNAGTNHRFPPAHFNIGFTSPKLIPPQDT